MTGIFLYKVKGNGPLPADIRKIAKRVSHRGKHRSWVVDSGGCFISVYLNKPQKDNICVVDDAQKEVPASFTVLDGYINIEPGLGAKGSTKPPKPVERARSLYKTGGVQAFSKVSGAFSLVIKENEAIIIARDSFGSNPLYYIDDDDKLVIASELKAFKGMDKFLRVLEPGTAFLTDGHRSCVRRFYDTRSFLEVESQFQGTEAREAEVELRTMVDRAVMRSIPRDAKTSALLSGGLDSSVVCALAVKHVPVLDAYVASYGDSDDLINARRFVDRYNDQVRLHVVNYDLDDMLRAIPDVISSLETFDAALVRSALPMHIACTNIDDGTDVLLTGEGCDELFAGYSYLKKLAPEKLDEELIHLLEVEHATGLQRVDRIPYHFGIEARAPWFDLDIARFAFKLPAQLKIKRDRGSLIEKWIVRDTFKDLLPDEITWRKKAKFSQGSGSELVMRDYLETQISDAEFFKENEIAPGVFARSKEELYYWRVFDECFKPSDDFVKKMPRTEEFSV
nr:asparagine synthase-related protein [Candidatus Sigynarchaeum springense]MDO8119540.1 asparagine synthase-related protein [Candidatus Sigynarchaeota archaeon]